MIPASRSSEQALARALFVVLAAAGLAFWFVIGLPWGPHNESFDWVVRLEQRTIWQALFEKFPSVLSLRPIGTGAAWILYRLGGHDPGFAEMVNAALTLLAWGWTAHTMRETRLFALVAFVAGGVLFAGYIWVFHLHGVFYGPLLLFLAALVRAARGPLDVRALLGVFVGALVTALVHPYALPLALVFVVGALLETPRLRTRDGVVASVVVATGVIAAYLLLVPSYNRDMGGDPLIGLVTSLRTTEVNAIGSAVAGLLAAWTASRVFNGAAGAAAAAFTLLVAAAGVWLDMPVLPLWFAWAALKGLRRGHVTLAALVAGTALLPLANPTGSPTYAVFVVFAAACASVAGEPLIESRLAGVKPWPVAGVLVAMLALSLSVRAGVAVPVVASVARPLLAEGERTRQFTGLADTLMAGPWRDHAVRFLHPAVNPTETDAVDRRFRPPTEDAHLATWLDWKRGGPPTVADTLVFTFGGEVAAGMDTVLLARGRYAGDALVWRRPTAPRVGDGPLNP